MTDAAALSPASVGIGFKPEHFQAQRDSPPRLGFWEVHAENYMVAGGPKLRMLEQLRADYPLTLHGVGLSIGGPDPLDPAHLMRLARLIARFQPAHFSEHLAWSSHGGTYFNDLLPLPYRPDTLNRVCDHLDEVQCRLGRRILLENPSTYVTFKSSTRSEGEFLREVVKRTGCGLLLDVNNLYISSINHARDPEQALAALPLHAVQQIHLAGHTTTQDLDSGPLLIDDHGSPVAGPVWQLYRKAIRLTGSKPTLIERDQNLPALDALVAEADLAAKAMADAREGVTA